MEWMDRVGQADKAAPRGSARVAITTSFREIGMKVMHVKLMRMTRSIGISKRPSGCWPRCGRCCVSFASGLSRNAVERREAGTSRKEKGPSGAS